MDDTIDQADGSETEISLGSSHRKAIIGWLLVLLVLAGLAALFWPRIERLMQHNEEASAAGNQAGLPLAQTGGAKAAQTGMIFHPKPAPKTYPPCTATRTDSCIQQEK
jgi:hypothetical protein